MNVGNKHNEEVITMTRYFKRVKNGVLDAVGRAETEEYANKLINDGFTEISKERYIKIMSHDLYISYRFE